MAHVLFVALRLAAAIGVPYHYRNPGALDHRQFAEARHQRHAQRLALISTQGVAASALLDDGTSHVITPAAFGADPSGRADSTAGMKAAIAALTALGSVTDDQGRIDLGGAILDLEGGTYSISAATVLPPGYANFRVQGGTLVARSNFSSAASGSREYLMHVGGPSCNSTSGGGKNKNCNSNVGIQQITLDAANIAWGGIMVEDTMNVNVGPAIYVAGFEGVGISLSGSGAGYIHEAWLGQYQPGRTKAPDTATAILLDGAQHDCDVNNVIVWSGLVGVNTTNGANRLQGVHTWNDAGKNGGTGIRLHKGSGRVEQCYLDYAPLVIGCPATESHHATLAMVEGNLFLGSSTIVLEALDKAAYAAGLVVTNNIFHTWNNANRTFVLDETNGKFAGVVNTIVDGNEVGPSVEKVGKIGTRATVVAAVVAGATNVTLDFSPALIFDAGVGIASVRCDLTGRFPTALSTVVKGNTVTVFFAVALPAWAASDTAVTCTVDQSTQSCAAH